MRLPRRNTTPSTRGNTSPQPGPRQHDRVHYGTADRSLRRAYWSTNAFSASTTAAARRSLRSFSKRNSTCRRVPWNSFGPA